METFTKGDIVEHKVLETKKIVVGIGKDRYLCVHPEDIGVDGRIRPNARVAMHRANNLQKVGYRHDVEGIDLGHLYQKESVARYPLVNRLMRQEVLAQGLFILAAVLIVLALLSGIDIARKELDRFVNKKVEDVKTDLYQKYYKEYETFKREKARYQGR